MKRKVLLVDNYDSFTHNIIIALKRHVQEVDLIHDDALTEQTFGSVLSTYSHIVLGPGPGCPEELFSYKKLIHTYSAKIPILGICLGHQAIGELFSAKVIRNTPCHGKPTEIFHNQKDLFENIPNPVTMVRYHSLIIEKTSLPKNLIITATTKEGLIMGIRHVQLPIYGVQFHPESIASQFGDRLFDNFLQENYL